MTVMRSSTLKMITGINHPTENHEGYVARGGRMLNYRTYVDLMDLLSRIHQVPKLG